jgi:hypothetical protein
MNKVNVWLSSHADKQVRENVFIPKHGVNKAVAEAYWTKKGTFNGQLFDQVIKAKIERDEN